MIEEPWTTLITITCSNEALQKYWLTIEDELRQCVYRCGWDTRLVGHKLREMIDALEAIRVKTPDMNLRPSQRFKKPA